jgi:hypothetical protein
MLFFKGKHTATFGHRKGKHMKDSKGNDFGLGSILTSSSSVDCSVRCVSVEDDIAVLESNEAGTGTIRLKRMISKCFSYFDLNSSSVNIV